MDHPPQPQRLSILPVAAFRTACSTSKSPSGCGETAANLPMSKFQRAWHEIPKAIQHEPSSQHQPNHRQNLELQLLPSSSSMMPFQDNHVNKEPSHLKLSMGLFGGQLREEEDQYQAKLTNVTMAEKEYAEEVRRRSRMEMEMAEMEFENAKRIRQQALGELERAKALRGQGSTMMEITCHACQQQFQANVMAAPLLAPVSEESSLAVSFMSSAVSEGEGH